MTTKTSRLLKAKAKSSASHNPEISQLVGQMQAEPEIPFQVKLPESLAKRVKIYSVESNMTHKQMVIEALEAYLKQRAS
jgi:hypothetical protein